VHVLLAVDTLQVVGCAVTMRSIVDNVRPGTRLRFHVFANGIASRDREALEGMFVGTSGARLIIYDVDCSRFHHLMRSKIVSHTTYARLLIQELLPQDVERCIYVDCDILVECDIVDAWEYPLEGKTAGAVANGDAADTAQHQRRLKLREARYLNAGFLVIDVCRWRQLGIGPRALVCAEAVGDDLILHDQDALNCVLQQDWVEMPRHWNAWVAMSSWLRDDSRAVFHFMGAPKPWEADYRGRFADHFARYLDGTPFAGKRPWNPLGLGALLSGARRRVPHLPAVVRIARRFLASRTPPDIA